MDNHSLYKHFVVENRPHNSDLSKICVVMDSSTKQTDIRNQRARSKYAAMSNEQREILNSRRRANYARRTAFKSNVPSDAPDQLINTTNIERNSLGIVCHSDGISSLQSGFGESVIVPVLCPMERCSESEPQCEASLIYLLYFV